jgi:hypothetical protein
MFRFTRFQCLSLLSIGADILVSSPRAEAALGCFDHSTYSSLIDVDDYPGTYMESLFLDDFLFVAAGNGGLRAFNTSDPDHTIYYTGALTDGQVQGLALFGDLLAIADGSMGLSILDLTVPNAPQPISSELTPAPALGVALGFPGEAGDHLYAFVACGAAGLVIVDCADLEDPATVATFDTPGTATEVLLQSEYAFVADGTGGLRVVDISDPTAPQPAADIPFLESTDLALDGTTLYTVGSTFPHLNVIDISDPENPDYVWTANAAAQASDVKVDGNRIYVAGPMSIQVLDRSNSTIPPVLMGSIPTGSGPQGVSARGDRAYASTGTGGVETLRVTDSFQGPASIPVAPGSGSSSVVEENTIYVAVGNTVRIYDNSGNSPVFLGSVSITGGIDAIDVQDQFLYSVSVGYPLRIHDVSDPASPQLVASIPPDVGYFLDVDVRNGIAFLCGSVVVLTYDVSDPGNPVALGVAMVPPQHAWALEATDDFLYVETRVDPTTHALRVFDLSNLAAPALRGEITFASPDVKADLAVLGSTVYIANETMNAPIIDVSDPDHPIQIATIPSAGPVHDISFLGETMAIAGPSAIFGGPSVTLVDVTNPSSPAVIGVVPSVAGANSVSFHGTTLVLTSSSGTKLLPGPCTTALDAPDVAANLSDLMLAVFPNPMRESGTNVSFDVPGSPALDLSIIDVAGRRVRTLLRSAHSGGAGSATWDACDDSGVRVAPGVYFVRLESAAANATRKIVVTR